MKKQRNGLEVQWEAAYVEDVNIYIPVSLKNRLYSGTLEIPFINNKVAQKAAVKQFNLKHLEKAHG